MPFWMTPYPTFESFRPKVLAENRLGAPAPANTLAGASALLVRAARPKGHPPSRRCLTFTRWCPSRADRLLLYALNISIGQKMVKLFPNATHLSLISI